MFPAITAGWVPPTGGMVQPFCSAAWSEPFQPPAGIIGIVTLCPLGLWLLWKRHRRLLEEYS